MSRFELLDVSVVLPTFNRASALAETMPALLRVRGVRELVVVVDRDTCDETLAVLERWDDGRVRVLEKRGPRGQAASRNQGVQEARGSWILFAEDDCCLAPDYAVRLHEDAARHTADIAGAPWLSLYPDQAERLFPLDPLPPNGLRPGLDTHSSIPSRVVETPFLSALSLIRRSVFDHVAFDDGYRGNEFREETAFFIEAARSGCRCILSPRTFAYQTHQWPGGARLSRPVYEYWTARNNWRFLRLHGRWLQERGFISSPLRYQLRFVSARAYKALSGRLRDRVPAIGKVPPP